MYHLLKNIFNASSVKKGIFFSKKGAPLPSVLYKMPPSIAQQSEQLEQRLATLSPKKNSHSTLLEPIDAPLFLTLLYPEFTFKVLDSTHRKLLLEHWLSLSAQDLYLRFFQPATAHFLAHRADHLNFEKTRIFGAFDTHGNLAACCEWALESTEGKVRHAECAFSTMAQHRTKGLGRHLALWCALDCYHNECTQLSLYFLKDNYGARALSKYLMGNKLTSVEPGVYKAQLDLSPFVKKHPAFQANYLQQQLEAHLGLEHSVVQ